MICLFEQTTHVYKEREKQKSTLKNNPKNFILN